MWTRLPGIRLLGLGLIGIWIHVGLAACLVGATLTIAFATGIYENMDWPKVASTLWLWYVFGFTAIPFTVGLGTWALADKLYQDKMSNKDYRVIVHSILLAYWVFRCAFSLAMMTTTSWLGVAFFVTLELDLVGLALVVALLVGLGYLCYWIPLKCINQCKKELEV